MWGTGDIPSKQSNEYLLSFSRQERFMDNCLLPQLCQFGALALGKSTDPKRLTQTLRAVERGSRLEGPVKMVRGL